MATAGSITSASPSSSSSRPMASSLFVPRAATTSPFLNPSTPTEPNDQEDVSNISNADDLSFLSAHAPRASMVENMALALDAFSNAHQPDPPYITRSNSYDFTTATTRSRGHTFSSSVSSDVEIRDSRLMPALVSGPTALTGGQMPRLARRDSALYRKNLQKLPSIFGEDEDSVRARVYDAQRAEHPALAARPRQNTRNSGKSSAGSASSSIDLGHLANFKGRLGAPGNRRSRSFDLGTTQARLGRRPSLTSDLVDVAPTPVIFAGPESQRSPTKSPVLSQSVVRKNSTRSSKSHHGPRKARAGTLATSTVKARPAAASEALPALPSFPYVATEPGQAPALHLPADASSFASSRPGFFRRVFGSSKNTASLLDPPVIPGPGSARPSHDLPLRERNVSSTTSTPHRLQRPPRTSSELSGGKENQAVVNKKPSSFFRRRKKSVSQNALSPLPLVLNSARFHAQPGEPSPVSSLRAFMDPYLATEGPASPTRGEDANASRLASLSSKEHRDYREHREQKEHLSRLRVDTTAQHPSQAGTPPPSSTTLRIPPLGSFLADSSSTEEPSRHSPVLTRSTSSDHDKAEPRNRYENTSLRAESGGRPSFITRQDSGTSDRGGVHDRDHDSTYSPARSQTAAPPSNPPAGTPTSIGSSAPRTRPEPIRLSTKASASDISDYRSAPSTPLVTESSAVNKAPKSAFPSVHVSQPSISQQQQQQPDSIDWYQQKARKIHDNADDTLDQSAAAAWLGDAGADRERVRVAFLQLFDFSGLAILASLRKLCARIVLRGESQQMDRLLDTFSKRWCECNPNHGFRSADVVHTLCYSILLLNTDLHLADIGHKMTRNQFVRNTMMTVKGVVIDEPATLSQTSTSGPQSPTLSRDEGSSQPPDSATIRVVSKRPTDREEWPEPADPTLGSTSSGLGGPLIDTTHTGSERGWDLHVESVLRSFYSSISQEPLPLFSGSQDVATSLNNNLLSSSGGNILRRTPSTISKAQSETQRGRIGAAGGASGAAGGLESKSLGARFMGKARSRSRLPSSATGFSSSKTSLDGGSSGWSPSMSSTWSKNSLGKTLTSASLHSFETDIAQQDYQSSIGFANALSQAIIRDDQMEMSHDELKSAPFLEDESLELHGAPWAKEGILKHKCHLEGVDRRSKDRNWNDSFAVVEKGWMRLFSFSMTAKSLRNKARNQQKSTTTGPVVGGGNWQDNAEEVWKFMLRHAIASTLPPPGYSKSRPFVWALSLPTGAVHLFSVGTPDIVKEFVSTVNFWSARLSKEPMMGGVSNMEYGWSDNIVNRALIGNGHDSASRTAGSGRPSTQLSMRSSMDTGSSVKARLPGDRAYINEWQPPQQSMMASQLLEVDQLKALQTYVNAVEEELQKHNEMRGPMMLAFSSKHPNSAKALSNWEKRSSYLLREIVKFRTYIDALQNAQATKERIYKMREEEEEASTKAREGGVT